MPPKPSNTRLKSARLAAGYHSQQALADALNVGVRQVRRWESEAPPWPHPELQQALIRVLGQDLEALGFVQHASCPDPVRRGLLGATVAAVGLAAVPSQTAAAMQPASVAADFEAVTRSHRRLYWSVAPATLHPAAVAHATLGCALLQETAGRTRQSVATALAETWLLAGRIEFFDLQEAEQASTTWLRALQAAGEADDSLLGAAILAHTAFIPAWAGRRDDAVERMVAARTYARRGRASPLLLAWLDAVEAECETRSGNTTTALHLLGHSEDILTAGGEHESPAWLDWFSPVRLAAFKGNTQLKAGHLPQARVTLRGVLEQLPVVEDKQRSVILGDLAAVEATAGNPEAACGYAREALDQLEATWYAMGMDRVREVRRQLAPHQNQQYVRDLDERLYGWSTTVSALAR
ncbi:helix-turn-helix transcriptional regulator [Streptomyces sp. NPDC102451]|uniref:helix-turn-helix transcriptional regulator n=1 Tax=Streptomyces sp. NPDC102451 TaxID=3366177 RepID=UPI00381B1C9D